MSRNLQLQWTKGLSGKEKEDFSNLIRNSTAQFRPIIDYLQDLENEIYNDESSEADYGNREWAYLQAHRNGKKEIIRKLRTLLDF